MKKLMGAFLCLSLSLVFGATNTGCSKKEDLTKAAKEKADKAAADLKAGAEKTAADLKASAEKTAADLKAAAEKAAADLKAKLPVAIPEIKPEVKVPVAIPEIKPEVKVPVVPEVKKDLPVPPKVEPAPKAKEDLPVPPKVEPKKADAPKTDAPKLDLPKDAPKLDLPKDAPKSEAMLPATTRVGAYDAPSTIPPLKICGHGPNWTGSKLDAPPPGAGFVTVIWLIAHCAMLAGSTEIFSSPPLTKVAEVGAPFQVTVEPDRKLEPDTLTAC